MSTDSTYNYEGKDFVIQNGVIKGITVPPPTKHTNYGEFLLDCMKAQPDFVGQVDGVTGREETFAEMTEKSVKCALWLKKRNIKPGDVIGICTHNQPDMFVPCFASLYIGAVFNPWWDAGLTKEVTRHFITLTKPKLLFANEISAPMIAEVVRELGISMPIIVFGKLTGFQSLDDIIATQDSQLVTKFRCTKLSSWDAPALILWTSGSTGLPKGVLHSHKSLIGNIDRRISCNTDGPVTKILFSPLAWGTAILTMCKGVTQPERRIVHPEFSEELALKLIEKYKINWTLLGTSAACRLHKCPAIRSYDLSSLKKIVITGGVLKEETHKAMAETFPQTDIGQVYGSTEFGAVVLQTSATNKFGSCGTIVSNFSMKILDPESGKILGPNQTGEARFKSPHMMTCYYNNPQASSEIFDDEGWLITGDLAHYDEEGFVFITDRIKELIKYRGNHVSPAMIERVLQSHPDVSAAAVLAIPHDIDDEHPIAFVTTTPTSKVTKSELEKLVAETLPDYMKLRGGVEFMKTMPHTASGKIARGELRKLAISYGRS